MPTPHHRSTPHLLVTSLITLPALASWGCSDDESEPADLRDAGQSEMDASTRADASSVQIDGGRGSTMDAAHRAEDANRGRSDGQTTATMQPARDVGSDAGASPTCGTEVLPTERITGTEGIAIAADGTLYYSQEGAVGRRRPGQTPEPVWVDLGSSASTVWGIALGKDGALYIASADEGVVYRVDPTAAQPKAEVFGSQAGSVNGLTVGPDGAVYASDFEGGWGGAATALAGAATAIAAYARQRTALRLHDRLESGRQLQRYNDAHAARNRLRSSAFGLVSAGVLSLLVGAALYGFDRPELPTLLQPAPDAGAAADKQAPAELIGGPAWDGERIGVEVHGRF